MLDQLVIMDDVYISTGQTTQRYAHLECRGVSQRAGDTMEALNSVPDGGTVESDMQIAELGHDAES